jgi:hypothetical protein
MTRPTNPPDDRHPIDELVREHLEREEAAVDAPRMLARVRAAKRAAPRRSRGLFMLASGLVAGIGIGGAAAALILVNLAAPKPPGSQPNELLAATPAELVRSVFVAHSDDTDRLYDVKVELGNTAVISKKYPFLPPPAHFTLIKDSKLWVRGNQFWIAPVGDPRCWGRDRDGRVWFVFFDQRGLPFGLQYGRDEHNDNDPVARLCNLMSLRVPTLAAEMLDDYELTRSEGSGPESPVRVMGKCRHHPREVAVSQVTLDLDPRTKVIRKAVQKRTIGNDLIGTFTYTLVETGRLPDLKYELRDHLEPGSRIFDAKDKAGRNDMFNRFPFPPPFKKS